MSSVRMCDKCGQIFSENADGWETFTATKRIHAEERPRVVQLDACPDCSFMGNVEPRVKAVMGMPYVEPKTEPTNG